MPIYEYICKRCEHRFEELVLGSEQPACPSCAAEQVEKQLSVFAVNSPSGGSARATAGLRGATGINGQQRPVVAQ